MEVQGNITRVTRGSTHRDISNVLFGAEQATEDDGIRRFKVVDELRRHVVDLHSDIETRSETLVFDACLFTQPVKLGSI